MTNVIPGPGSRLRSQSNRRRVSVSTQTAFRTVGLLRGFRFANRKKRVRRINEEGFRQVLLKNREEPLAKP